MPSVKNPNKPSKNRLAARRASTKKRAQKSSEAGRLSRIGITKADAARGAKPGLLPTSGPRAALSKKKLKKLEQRVRLATQRAEKAEADKEGGELVMRDAPVDKSTTKSKTKERGQQADVEMDIE